ncbi:hypothetical protein [Ruegeria faecimaris]|uniref:hypothetical protein n=1 Tax=Ruegeria faecimaris TaxID=686389 RepID=UPI0023313B46|nr:hypothetical protein [Ruegeria faecimaris]
MAALKRRNKSKGIDMITKRAFFVAIAATLLSACSNITEIDRDQKDTGPLKLNAVVVDVSDLSVTTEGRSINRTTAQLQEDMRRAVTAEAEKRSVPDGLPANINVNVEKVFLARAVDRVLTGTSFIESVVSVTDAETGAFIVKPIKVKSTAEQLRGPGPIGAATAATTSLTADYNNVINAYAKALLASLDASS